MPNPGGILLDTGPLVAALDADDAHHAWAIGEFRRFTGPVRVCEAVVAEACYLLRRMRPAQEKILQWIEKEELRCDFILPGEIRSVRELWSRYENVPMSLADACLVRMAEIYPRAAICTVDSDFSIYRKHRREPLTIITPER